MTTPEAAIDEILTYMGLADLSPAFGAEALAVSRPVFDRAIPYALLGESLGWDKQDIFRDVRASDLDSALNICFLTQDDERRPQDITSQRIRRVQAAEIRGQTKGTWPNMVERSICWIDRSTGKGTTSRSIWAETRALEWKRIDNFPMGIRESESAASERLNLAHGVQFTARYQWTVYLAAPPYPGILIPTSPAGVLEAWRLRELPEGASRRNALRHVVNAHIRHTENEETQADIFVREHLRGQETFRWNGLVVRITPSRFDLERIERGKVTRRSL